MLRAIRAITKLIPIISSDFVYPMEDSDIWCRKLHLLFSRSKVNVKRARGQFFPYDLNIAFIIPSAVVFYIVFTDINVNFYTKWVN